MGGAARGLSLLGRLGGLTPAESRLLQRRAVERAISLDNLSGEAYSARAHVRVQYEWDYPGADPDYRRALQLTPGSALNHCSTPSSSAWSASMTPPSL